MARVGSILATARTTPWDARFSGVQRFCERRFGPPSQRGASHCALKVPWPGDPRVNIQDSKGGKVEEHQVRQVIAAIDKPWAIQAASGRSDDDA